MARTALVTGAAGFIGSHLCEELLHRGNIVIGVDNLFRGNRNNLNGFDDSAFRLHLMDLADSSSTSEIAELVEANRPDQVFHYGAINGTQYFYEQPLRVLKANIDMTTNVLDGLVQGGFSGKLIYASSSEVYGNPSEIPTPESHPVVLRPEMDRDGYALSKVVGEMKVRLTATEQDWDWLLLRIFNCYGPRMDYSEHAHVIPEFIRKANADTEFTVVGDGHQTRSFCYVTNTVWQTLQCAEVANKDAINIGNDTEVEILEVAKRIHDLAGKTFSPVHLPAWPGDRKRRCPSLKKLREWVGELRLVDLNEGLEKTYQHFIEQQLEQQQIKRVSG